MRNLVGYSVVLLNPFSFAATKAWPGPSPHISGRQRGRAPALPAFYLRQPVVHVCITACNFLRNGSSSMPEAAALRIARTRAQEGESVMNATNSKGWNFFLLNLIVIVGSQRHAPFAARAKTFTGTVSDSMCGAKHAMPGDDAACTRACVGKGSKYALVVGRQGLYARHQR